MTHASEAWDTRAVHGIQVVQGFRRGAFRHPSNLLSSTCCTPSLPSIWERGGGGVRKWTGQNPPSTAQATNPGSQSIRGFQVCQDRGHPPQTYAVSRYARAPLSVMGTPNCTREQCRNSVKIVGNSAETVQSCMRNGAHKTADWELWGPLVSTCLPPTHAPSPPKEIDPKQTPPPQPWRWLPALCTAPQTYALCPMGHSDPRKLASGRVVMYNECGREVPAVRQCPASQHGPDTPRDLSTASVIPEIHRKGRDHHALWALLQVVLRVIGGVGAGAGTVTLDKRRCARAAQERPLSHSGAVPQRPRWRNRCSLCNGL